MSGENLTKEQRAARITMFFGMHARMTKEEVAALELPFSQWPESLKAKAGDFAWLIEKGFEINVKK